MDMQLIKAFSHEHGLMVGLAAGAMLPLVLARMFPYLVKVIVVSTAKVLPPVVGATHKVVLLGLAHPIARILIIQNGKDIKALTEAIRQFLIAIINAVDSEIDKDIDAAMGGGVPTSASHTTDTASGPGPS
jgi:hypothetical protein